MYCMLQLNERDVTEYWDLLLRAYVFDFDKELSPSPVEQKKLLFQVPGDRLVARLDEKIPRVIHVHVLLDPVRKVPEEFL